MKFVQLQMVDIIAMYLLEEHTALCSDVGFVLADLKNYVRACVYDSLSVYTSSLRVSVKCY